MSELRRMNEQEIVDRLAQLPDWRLADDKLHRELQFQDFVQAFGFMAQIAIIAERSNHHPEWFNVYNRVVIDLATHDVGGISASDFALARHIDRVAAALLPPST